MKRVSLFNRETFSSLRAGDEVLLSGTIYTARDAAHKRLIALLDQHEPLPFEIRNAVIYYVGPTPAKPGFPFGSGGPTTSGRMDVYTPRLLRAGLIGMIGKGYRGDEVKRAMKETGAVYFGAVGGAGAVISRSVIKSQVIAFADLGPEAVRELLVKDFPCTVIIDALGNDLYETGRRDYLSHRAG